MVGNGVNFDAEIDLTVGADGLRYAFLAGVGRLQAYVLRAPAGSMLGQLHFLGTEQHARLAYVAPGRGDDAPESLWLSLLDGLAMMAGQRGVITLIAEVSLPSPEFETLRKAGFATYTRQDIWRREPAPLDPTPYALRDAQFAEEHALHSLYGALVPGLIKHVEPPPIEADEWFVLEEARGAAGMVAVYRGGENSLIELYHSPEASIAGRAFLTAALHAVEAEKRTIYCRARDYMGCMPEALAGAGFEHVAEQAVMVRHTAVRVTRRAYMIKETVEGGIPLPTSIVDAPEAM